MLLMQSSGTVPHGVEMTDSSEPRPDRKSLFRLRISSPSYGELQRPFNLSEPKIVSNSHVPKIGRGLFGTEIPECHPRFLNTDRLFRRHRFKSKLLPVDTRTGEEQRTPSADRTDPRELLLLIYSVCCSGTKSLAENLFLGRHVRSILLVPLHSLLWVPAHLGESAVLRA